jgi:hypothetical protein
MAQLSSPGVSVTVIDESFYTPAAPGTTPLIIVASAENKANGSNTGTASGTLAANAGKVYLLTSQKDLADTFGTPVFKTDANNNPIHAGEQNEFGLQAAYSYLGVSNRAFVVRAGIDLDQLEARADAPSGQPIDGQYWLDTANTKFGIFQWNSSAATIPGGQTFTNNVPLVITTDSKLDPANGYGPKQSIGALGAYAVVAHNSEYSLWYKKTKTHTAAGGWVAVGSAEWKASWPSAQGTTASPTIASEDMFTIRVDGADFDFTGYSTVENLVSAINAQEENTGVSAEIINSRVELYNNGSYDGAIQLTGSTVPKLGLVDSGIYLAPALEIKPHTGVPLYKRTDEPATEQGYPTGSVWVKTTEPNLGSRWRVKVYNEATMAWVEKSSLIYPSASAALKGLDNTGGGINLTQGSLFIKSDVNEELDMYSRPAHANFKIYVRKSAGLTEIVSASDVTFDSSGTNTFYIQESVKGKTTLSDQLEISFNGTDGVDGFISALTAALADTTWNSTAVVSSITVTKNALGQVVIHHATGGEIVFTELAGSPIGDLFTPFSVDVAGNTTGTINFYNSPSSTSDYVASLWTPYADITSAATAPTTEAADGQLWYNSMIDEVDVMIHNGTTWVGYLNKDIPAGEQATWSGGPIVSATKPKTNPDGNSLWTGDLWIDTSDIENYPSIYKYNKNLAKWISVDTGDQTTEDGIVFGDARWDVDGGNVDTGPSSTAIKDLLYSNFLDFDAPDPALYPKGMLLWNLRRSGFNVKRFVRNYIDPTVDNPRQDGASQVDYYVNRWVTESSNQENGAGTFGRKAQRKVVIQSLQAMVNSNQQLRDEESRIFNLIACPGYPELIGEMVALNYDRGLTAFVVGDTPARLKADATSLNNWGKNTAGAVEDNDSGLVSSDEYLGVFYPWGYTSDNVGNNIVVPPSHMILRTIALSDQVSYPWFAPAGTRRGGITNATAVGYITAEGEFQSVALNTGQRDTLSAVKVNPITFITGTGLVNYGQYTRAKNASALDRINVARLVIYLRRQFSQLAKPYVFEPNDKITRDELKGAAESLLLELVGQRALYDYIVVCDTSNNTPARIDRNELYLDVAIEPVKSVEFIYIPLRLKNTGEIAGLTK